MSASSRSAGETEGEGGAVATRAGRRPGPSRREGHLARGLAVLGLLVCLLASLLPATVPAAGAAPVADGPAGGPLAGALASLADAPTVASPPVSGCRLSGPYAATCPGIGGAERPGAALSGPTWQRINTSRAPSPRTDAQMVYDIAASEVVLFGGSNATLTAPVCQAGCAGAYADTWTYTGGHWTRLNISGPSPRVGESLVYDAADGVVLLFGGELACPRISCPVSGDTWTFSGGRWTQLFISGPSPRFDAPITYDARDGYVLLFGGVLGSGEVANDTWIFRGGGWTPLGIHGPPPDAYQESMTYDAADGYVLLVGNGAPGLAGLEPNVTWTYARGHWSEEFPATSPPFVWGAWVAYDPAVAYVVLVGEQVYPQYGAPVNVTWGYLGGSWFPVPTVNPTLRLGLSPLVYDAADGYLLAFGGEQWPNGTLSGGLLNDTWSFVAPPLGFDFSVAADPPGICIGNADSCPASTNVTRITLSLEAVYEPGPAIPGLSVALPAAPEMLFVPFGNLGFSTNLSRLDPTASCFDPIGFTTDCDTNTTLVPIAPGVVGLEWGWSAAPDRNQFVDRARWSASFNAYATAPPFGTFPVDACITPSCYGFGSTAVNGSFTSVTVRPFENATVESISFPPGLLTLEPPSGPPPPPIQNVLPPPPPSPILPPPATAPVVPPGAPGSTPVPPGAGPGLLAPAPIASGAIAAGFTRLRVKRKVSMAVAAPSGALTARPGAKAPTAPPRAGGRPGKNPPPPPRRSIFGD